MTQNRRQFISTMAVAGAAIPVASAFGSFIPGTAETRYPLRLFSKVIDKYDFDFMCECTKRSGFGGFDMTIRPGGKIEPSDVEKLLPDYISQAKKYDLAIDMMTSGIVNIKDPLTDVVLKTTSKSGITHYRLGYLEYDYKLGIWESIQKHKADLKGVVDLNKKYNMHGGYQNHAGVRLGGPVWDVYELVHEFDPANAGCQYDVRHAMVEGANAWIIGMRLLASHIKTLAIKDFTWQNINGKPRAVTVPMGEGMINWDTFFATVKELNIAGPLTLHIEYPLLEKEEEKLPLSLQQDIIVKKIKKDVDFVLGYLNKYQLS